MAKKAAKAPAKASAKASAKEAKAPAKKAAVKAAPKAAKAAPKVAEKTKPAAKAKGADKSVKTAAKAESKLKLVPPPELDVNFDDEGDAVELAVVVKAPAAEKAKVVKAPKAKAAPRLSKKEAASASEDESRWTDLHERYRAEKPQVYDMKATFESGKPLQHKLLGWGWILSNENDRLEVLFKDGRRMLISNYNPHR